MKKIELVHNDEVEEQKEYSARIHVEILLIDGQRKTIDLELHYQDNKTIRFTELMSVLARNKYALGNLQIFYFSEEEGTYVLIGVYAEPWTGPDVNIPVPENQVIRLKFRSACPQSLISIKQPIAQNERRERWTIHKIVTTIYHWRSLMGKIAPRGIQGTERKYTRKEAADKLGVLEQTKTLDAYLKDLKAGVENGFPFNEYRDCGIGLLKRFNKAKENARNMKA